MTRVKSGGRKAGTKNKVTGELRQSLANVISNEIETLPDRLDKLGAAERVDVLCKLCKYVLPSMVAVDAKAADKQTLDVDSHIKKISKGIDYDNLMNF